MSEIRILCLGAGEGWHASQLRQAAVDAGCEFEISTYESLRGSVGDDGVSVHCGAGVVTDYDVVLARTMPTGSLEQVTFRLATLHVLSAQMAHPSTVGLTRSTARSTCAGERALVPVINAPRSLEIAIDKFATLARVAALGHPIPETIVVQSRTEAMEAFGMLGGDCVIKPIFGGEGRGVMRIRDPELAWYTFSTLENLGAVCYVQRFVPPGGRDLRLLVIGDEVIGVRRTNQRDFRTNVSGGGNCEATSASEHQRHLAREICDDIGLKFAAVDLIDCDHGPPRVVEVNGIPGWKGAQRVLTDSIAQRIIALLIREASPRLGAVG